MWIRSNHSKLELNWDIIEFFETLKGSKMVIKFVHNVFSPDSLILYDSFSFSRYKAMHMDNIRVNVCGL